ncbi:MAG: efflux RND transporter periplasmic adaptor subunit [Planctomycetaceae bacterium]|nr:efflux RND transporter periplasmic adaptor subunit [Planctomycetaceae bacterium]
MAGVVVVVAGCGVLAGCGGHAPAQSGPPVPEAPEVHVSVPVMAEVTDYQDFPGRLAAVNSVEVRARVTGYLNKIHFEEGSEVEQGDLLFEIDPRPYEAELARAKGSVVQAEGRLKRLESEFKRAKDLAERKAISQEEIDRITGDRTEALGAVAVSEAAVEMAELNLSFTKVTAPLSGRIGNRTLDPGNLVKADETSVTVIVSTNPIYVNFDLDERTMLRLKRLIAEKKISWSTKGGIPVLIGLADEEGYPHAGTINFADNRVDADSGTWRLRGRFDNSDGLLTPGLFVRVRLPIGGPVKSLLITEEALSTDQGQKFVYVVKPDKMVEYRRIKVGRIHDGLRVVLDGLTTGEQIIHSGLQRARPGNPVAPKVVEMPGAERLIPKKAGESKAKEAAEPPKTETKDEKTDSKAGEKKK